MIGGGCGGRLGYCGHVCCGHGSGARTRRRAGRRDLGRVPGRSARGGRGDRAEHRGAHRGDPATRACGWEAPAARLHLLGVSRRRRPGRPGDLAGRGGGRAPAHDGPPARRCDGRRRRAPGCADGAGAPDRRRAGARAGRPGAGRGRGRDRRGRPRRGVRRAAGRHGRVPCGPPGGRCGAPGPDAARARAGRLPLGGERRRRSRHGRLPQRWRVHRGGTAVVRRGPREGRSPGRRGRCVPTLGRSAPPSSSWTTSPTATRPPAPRGPRPPTWLRRPRRRSTIRGWTGPPPTRSACSPSWWVPYDAGGGV